MQAIISYFQDFFQQINKPFLVFCTLFTAALVWLNYSFGIESKLLAVIPGRPARFLGFYSLYLLAFSIPYLFVALFVQQATPLPIPWFLILVAPAVFAYKVTAGGWQEGIQASAEFVNGRFQAVIYDLPIRFLLTVSCLLIIYYFFPSPIQNVLFSFGITTENFKWWPYILLLLAAIPLVAYAASQPAFLQAYPKLKVLRFLAPDGPTLLQKLQYELSYASDFLTIEIFFRGFLVVFLARYIGPAAILPMAVFYCSIHFGKPLLECISSYFGGILLGVIACYSQSILGGIIVHIGLAWMMEAAAIMAGARLLKG